MKIPHISFFTESSINHILLFRVLERKRLERKDYLAGMDIFGIIIDDIISTDEEGEGNGV